MLECWDRKHRTYVAIKIVRNVKKYRDAAMIEAGFFSDMDLSHLASPSCPGCCLLLMFMTALTLLSAVNQHYSSNAHIASLR